MGDLGKRKAVDPQTDRVNLHSAGETDRFVTIVPALAIDPRHPFATTDCTDITDVT